MKLKSEPTSRRKRTIKGWIAAAICRSKWNYCIVRTQGDPALQIMPYSKVSRCSNSAGGAVGKAGHDSSCLIAIFVDMPRQHAGLILGVQFSCRCGDERDRAFTHNALDAPTCWRIWILNRCLMNNPAFTDQRADEHREGAVLVRLLFRLQLICFEEKHHRVSKWTSVVNQRQGAAARQLVHEVLTNQLQRMQRSERLTTAADALYQDVNWMLQHTAGGSDVGQYDELALIHDTHGLYLLNHTIHQVRCLRELTHRGPEIFSQCSLFFRRQFRLRGVLTCILRALRGIILGELAPGADQRSLPTELLPKAAMMASTILSRAIGLAPAQIDS